MKKSIGIDIGGTKIAAAIIDEQGKIHYPITEKTDTTNAETLFEQVLYVIKHLLSISGEKIEAFDGIGIGLPGKVDVEKGIAVFQNNIPWHNFPIVQRLLEHYPNSVVKIDNDVKVAAYAEYRLLNLAKQDMFGYMTISTGIACTNIINNQILRGSGFSGEVGFVPVPSSVGLKPVELVAAGPAIEKEAQERYGDTTLTTKQVFEKWQQGENIATQVVEQSITGIALTLYSMICLLDPKVIVLGGSVAVHNPKYVERILCELKTMCHEEQMHIIEQIRVTELEGDNGLIGAGFLVMN